MHLFKFPRLRFKNELDKNQADRKKFQLITTQQYYKSRKAAICVEFPVCFVKKVKHF